MTLRYARIGLGFMTLVMMPVQVILAASPVADALGSMAQIPQQQFVTADDDNSSTDNNNNSNNTVVVQPAQTPPAQPYPTIPLQQNPGTGTILPITSNQVQPALPLTTPAPNSQNTLPTTPQPNAAFVQTIPPPNTNLPLPPPVTPTPTAALPTATEAGGQIVPLSSDDAAQAVTPYMAGGIDTRPFVYCSRLSAVTCNRATNDATYRSCLSTITQPACRQFMVFAATTSFNRGDMIDNVQHFNQGQLDLIRVRRAGVNYPGDYYVVGVKGTVYNITSGQEAQAINIKASPDFPNIQQRFPQAQLWSIVEQPPRAESLQTGGLRLVFRFKVLNGCPTCETAALANVAYDFSPEGILQQVQLLSLDGG